MKTNKFLKISGWLCVCLFWLIQSSFATKEIDTNLDVGAIDGAHAVNLTGAFTYTIPIKIPEGTMGMQPNLSLNYNSQSGNGIAGYGWNLSGMSAISRVNKNIYYDGYNSAPDLSINDGLALDGNRILQKANYVVDNKTRRGYYAEMETFQRIYTPDNNSIENFIVETKDGKTIEYGFNDNAKLMAEDGITPLVWYINKVTDRNGNYMTYHYTKYGRQVVLSRIEYTGNDTADPGQTILSPFAKVEFSYENRNDKSNAYISGSKIENHKILDRITIRTSNAHYKSYQLKYDYKDFNYLSEFQEWGSGITDNGKNRLNSLTFEYGDKATSVKTLNFSSDKLFNGLPKTQTDIEKWVYIPGNFNGDGLQDFLGLKMWIDKSVISPDEAAYNEVSIFLNNNKKNSSGFTKMDISGESTGENLLLYYFTGRSQYTENSIQPVTGRTIYTGDINGDNIDDIVVKRSNGNFKYFKSVKTGEYIFDSNNNELNVRDKNISRLVDADGDGRLELLVIDEGEDDNKLYLTSFDSRVNIVKDNFAPGLKDLPWKLHTKDFDGTGKTEIIVTDIPFEADDYKLSFNIQQASNPINFSKLNSGGGVTNTSLNSYWLHANRKDFNGDGKEDDVLILFDKNIVRVNINNAILETNVPLPYGQQELVTADFNGDSYTDFLMVRKGTPDEADFYLNKGEGTDYQKIEHQFTNGTYFNNSNGFDGEKNLLQLTDIDGDGIQEIFLKRPDLATPKVFHLNFKTENRLLNIVRDSYTNETKVHYDNLSNEVNYAVTENSTYPLRTVNGALYVTTKVEIPTNQTNVLGNHLFGSKEYTYENLTAHLEGKGLLGFTKVTEIDNINEVITESNFALDDETSTMLLPVNSIKKLMTPIDDCDTDTDVDCGKISESFSSYTVIEKTSPIRQWLRLDKTTTIDYTNKTKTIVDYKTYDTNFGNLKNSETKVYDISPENEVLKYSTTEVADYFNCSWWATYLPKSMSTTLNRSGYTGTNTRTVNYEHNTATGNLEKETTDPTTDNEIITTYSNFDKFGNPKSTKVVANAETDKPERSVSILIDNTGRYTTKEYNSNGNLIKQTTINKIWGLPTTVTDIEGNTSSFTYDNYGRLSTTTNYLSKVSAINRSWLNEDDTKTINDVKNLGHDITPAIYKVVSTKPNAPEMVAFYDDFGREALNKTAIFGGSEVYGFKKFDDRGRLKYESGPFELGENKDKPTFTNYTYDNLNRVAVSNLTRSVDNVVEIFNTINYSYPTRMVEVTGTDIIAKTTTYDVTGKVIAVQDPGGQLNYSYNNFNELYQVKDTNDNVLTENEYDDFGRQTALIDINAGTTTYKYNAFDELISQTDAKNNTSTITYDKLGRISTKKIKDASNTELDYNYIYNTATANGALSLNTEIGPNGYSSTYTYDNYGRQISYTDNVGSKSFTTSQTYNGFGDIKAITYPGDFTVDYEYDSNTGAFYKATAGTKVLYEMEAINHLGQITNYKYNNGAIPVEHTFNDLGMPKTVKADNGNLFNWEYGFNITNGNLTNRKDVKNNKYESFNYDNLHRLTHVNNEEFVKYGYDGNIDYKQDAGDYTYNKPNGKINAVTGISNNTNAIPLLTECITYTAFDRPESIVEEGKNYELFYGPDDQRKKAVYTENGITTTKYYSGSYEETVTGNCSASQSIYYLSFANSVDVIYHKQNEAPQGCRAGSDAALTNEFHYVFTDYLGSILKVVDEAGNTKEEQSFDAWGRKRNPANWQVYDQPEDALPKNLTWLNRGYTGHEHLYQFGIINMNNRLYDPIVGRMLAVDNFVADSESTQAYNRYSYAMNNPLKYTDPSGEFAHLIVGAVIGGLVNWAMNGAQFNLQGLAYFGVGALAGALGAGVGAGISSALAGGAFGAGFLGSQAALSVTSSFLSGAIVGGGAGFAGGFTNGFGNSLVSGESFGNSLKAGLKAGLMGGLSGAALGGIFGGFDAVYGDSNHTRNFWTGKDVGTGRNPFALNNSDISSNAWRSKNKYIAKMYSEKVYNSSSNRPGDNYVRYGHGDENGISDGLISRVENYTYESNGIIQYDVSRFKGRADFQLLQKGNHDVVIRVDGNVVLPNSKGYIPIYEGTKTISVHAIQHNIYSNPVNNGILISPARYTIEGHIKFY